jgi:hypothetical protein
MTIPDLLFCRTGLWQAIHTIVRQEELAGNHPLQMAERSHPARRQVRPGFKRLRRIVERANVA